MGKNRKTIILIITLVLIVSLGIFLYSKYLNDEREKEEEKFALLIQNNWIRSKTEVYKNDELDMTYVNDRYFVLRIDKDELDICYYISEEGGDMACDNVDYIYSNGNINISSNDTFLAGDYKIYFSSEYLVLESVNEYHKALIYFKDVSKS